MASKIVGGGKPQGKTGGVEDGSGNLKQEILEIIITRTRIGSEQVDQCVVYAPKEHEPGHPFIFTTMPEGKDIIISRWENKSNPNGTRTPEILAQYNLKGEKIDMQSHSTLPRPADIKRK